MVSDDHIGRGRALRIAVGILLIIIALAGGANALSSDDFNSPTLNESLWTIINPRGDATFSMANTGSPYASLGITIPGGTSHDAYNGNWAPHIMQKADNSDFEVEVKFLSLMNKTFQMQGIIIEQDEQNFLRFDFHSKGQKNWIYSANFTNGSLSQINNREIGAFTNRAIPLYMRVKRVGNNWTQSYSFDGTHWIAQPSFNRILTVTSVGPFVGNADGTSAGTSSPAFTGLIDYFFNTSSRIDPEDVEDTFAPNISVWYGNSQKFGQLGVPQQWVNILGNVYDESGITSLNYSLNNRADQTLSIGPDYRLESSGDFNVEINHTDLVCGDNQLVIKAADAKGNSKNEIVSVNYSCNNIWPQNYLINWSNETSIQDAAQIVDGMWIKEANSIRPGIIGYDRMIAIGDMNWKDYEITVPITINTPLDSSLSFGGPNFGFITRWQGHYDRNNKQPRTGWSPLGALGVYIWVPSVRDYRLQIIGNNMTVIADDTSGKHLDVGIPYMFKMRAQTNGTKTRYSLKVWQQNMTEPAGWTISGDGVAGELKHGSITMNAHNSDVSFGNVSIEPGPFNDDGDINGNGQLTLVDAIYLAKHVGGFSGYETIYADGDINADGKVTLVDAIYLAKHVGGFIGYEKIY